MMEAAPPITRRCPYCSSEIVCEVNTDGKVLCQWCHKTFPPNENARYIPMKEIYEARYAAELERRKLGMRKPQKPVVDMLRRKRPEIKMVNGIRITLLKKDYAYRQSFKRPLTLLEKVAAGANAIIQNPRHSRNFHAHVDIPELKCSIILEAVYIGGLTVGYHDRTDQIYIRPKGQCWQKFNLGDGK